MDQATPADVVYAGFVRRWGAYIIDGLILGIGFYLLTFVVMFIVMLAIPSHDLAEEEAATLFGVGYLALVLLYYVAAALYYALQESSRHQATVGKRAMGIKVTDAQGRRLGRGQAFGRWFAAALSYLTLYIGFLLAAFTERKRALHDMVADTLVVDRWAWTEHPERQQRHVGVAAIVVACFALFALVTVVGILAAIAIPAYQDYTLRAKVYQAMQAAQPLEAEIAGFLAREGHCPANGEGGIGEPAAYASAPVASIVTGALEDSGRCAIELTLGGTGATGLEGKRVWLEYEPADGSWGCSSELEDRYLPASCRE